jgi:hypothetical protein
MKNAGLGNTDLCTVPHRCAAQREVIMSNSEQSATTRSSGSLVGTAAMVVGAVFLLVGVLGFVPGVTTNYDDLTFAGHHSDALLLDIFEVSVLHNIVHLLFGVAGILAGRAGANAARGYLVGGGVIYLALWVYGLVVDHDSSANFVPLNNADNWLHLVLGIGMIGLGLVLAPSSSAAAGRRP